MEINGIKCRLTERYTDGMHVATLSAVGETISGVGDSTQQAREQAVEGMEFILDGHKIIEKEGTRFLMKYQEKDSEFFELYHHVTAHNADTGNVGVGEDPDIDYAEYKAIETALQ